MMNTEMKPVYVATYGSLRRNMGNHRVNRFAEAKLVGLGNTEKNFDLFAYCSSFPSVSLAHSSAEKPVRVEVYETTLGGLTGPYDNLEGFPSFYNRTKVSINMDNGDLLDAWIYHIDVDQGIPVESGDWCLYKHGEDYYDSLKD